MVHLQLITKHLIYNLHSFLTSVTQKRRKTLKVLTYQFSNWNKSVTLVLQVNDNSDCDTEPWCIKIIKFVCVVYGSKCNFATADENMSYS
jgi:hypothetical protein